MLRTGERFLVAMDPCCLRTDFYLKDLVVSKNRKDKTI